MSGLLLHCHKLHATGSAFKLALDPKTISTGISSQHALHKPVGTQMIIDSLACLPRLNITVHLCRKRRVLLDVGCGTGAEIGRYLAANPSQRNSIQVHAFEPNPVHLQHLKAALALMSQVTVHEAAAWITDEQVMHAFTLVALACSMHAAVLHFVVNCTAYVPVYLYITDPCCRLVYNLLPQKAVACSYLHHPKRDVIVSWLQACETRLTVGALSSPGCPGLLLHLCCKVCLSQNPFLTYLSNDMALLTTCCFSQYNKHFEK